MRERIVAEAEGGRQLRGGWDVALSCYIDCITGSCFAGREAAYSRELFISQVRFITELPGIENFRGEIFWLGLAFYVLEIISGDDLRETRHKLARLIVLRETEKMFEFLSWDSDCRRAADLILGEFGAEDPELSDKLNEMIVMAAQESAENADRLRKKEEESGALLSQMA